MIDKISKFIFLLSVMSFCLIMISCSTELRLDKQPRVNLKFSELPDTIKKIYYWAAEPYYKITPNGDTMGFQGDRIDFLSIDTTIKRTNFEIKKTMSFIDEFVFHIDDKKLVLPFSSNTINAPYILYDQDLYFVITQIIDDRKAVEQASYGKFNLKGVLTNATYIQTAK